MRDKAVQEAVQIGTLNPSNSEAVKAFRITVPTPELPECIFKVLTSSGNRLRVTKLCRKLYKSVP